MGNAGSSSGGAGSSSGTSGGAIVDDGGDEAAPTSSGKRGSTMEVLVPEASGVTVLRSDDGTCELDISNIEKGYVMAKYTGTSQNVRLRITDLSSNPVDGKAPFFTHYVFNNTYYAFPLSKGSGKYRFQFLDPMEEPDENGKFGSAQLLAYEATVKLEDDKLPYLYANQYSDFNKNTSVVKTASDLAASADTDLDVVANVYQYVVKTLSYDYDRVAGGDLVFKENIPDIEKTISSKKGICFDYAAVMTAMLRSQAIPTQLAIGYAGETYHAWINVYTKEEGWVYNAIHFDGNTWTLMDPTFASTSSRGVKFKPERVYNIQRLY